MNGEEIIPAMEALKGAGVPSLVAVALIWATLFRKKDPVEHDGMGEKFDAFYRDVIDRLARIETELELMRGKK